MAESHPAVDAQSQARYNKQALSRNPAIGESRLSTVRLAEGETFESLLKRFNKRVQQDGILSEIRRRQHFEPPSVRRKKKEAAKRRKSRRNS